MPTVSLARLRSLLAQATDPTFFAGSLTTIGAAAGATIIDTKLSRFNPNRVVGKWVTITSGTTPPPGESQRVLSLSNDAVGTLTPVRAFTAQVASGVTYELTEQDPDKLESAIQEALRVFTAKSPLWLPDETLVIDNLISNWDFETFAGGAFTSWVSVGAPTLTQNTDYFLHGSNAANIAGAAAEGIEQDLLIAANALARIDQAVGKALHVRGSLRTGATQKRLRVTFNGTTYTNSPDHDGDGDWERLAIDVAIPADPTEMTVSIESANTIVAAGFQADVVVAWIDPIVRYTVPTSYVHPTPFRVSQQQYEAAPNGNYESLIEGVLPVPGRIMRLEGYGRLTVPTTDSGTAEIDESVAEVVVAYAAAYLFGTLNDTEKELKWLATASRLAGEIPAPIYPPTWNLRSPWKVQNDSGTLRLLLNSRR